jgi:tight adherence protein B
MPDLPVLPPFAVGSLDVRAIALSLVLGGAVWYLSTALLPPMHLGENRRATWIERHVGERLRRARLFDVRVRDVVGASVLTAVLGWWLASRLTGWPTLALMGLLLGGAVPLTLIELRAGRRHAELSSALVDAIRQLRDAMGASSSLQGGLGALARTGPATLRPEFQRVLDRQDVPGVGLDGALRELDHRLADPIGEQLVNALRMNLDTGGSELTRSLDDLAELAQGELEIRALIRVEQFRTVITAQVLAGAPLAILLYLRLTSPRSVAAFDQPVGQLVLLLCAASCIVGYLAMVRAGSIPERPRLFSGEGET